MNNIIKEFKSAWKIFMMMFLPTSLVAGVPLVVSKLFNSDFKMSWLQTLTPFWVPLMGLTLVALGFMTISTLIGFGKLIRSKNRGY